MVQKSKNVSILHIASMKRMKTLFTLSDLCAVDFSIGEIRHACCGKVSVVCNGKREIGYIMDEKGDKWKILLRTNRVICIPKVKMLHDDDGNFVSYIYNDISSQKKWNTTMYWPIRMKFSVNAVQKWQYMINHITLKKGTVLIQLSS